jgi:hypothetical protein
MIFNSFFDLGPAPLGLAIARSHTEFSSQTFEGQYSPSNSGHDRSCLDASTKANLFEVI